MNHAQRIGSGFVTSPVVMVVLESLSLIAQWISAEKALYLNSSRNGREGTSVYLMDVSDWHSPADLCWILQFQRGHSCEG